MINDNLRLKSTCISAVNENISMLNDIYDRVENQSFKRLIKNSCTKHNMLCMHLGININKIRENHGTKILNAVKLKNCTDDKKLAEFVANGCNSSLNSLCHSFNECKGANQKTTEIAQKLIKIEENLASDVRRYL